MSNLHVEKRISKYGILGLVITSSSHISATMKADVNGTVYDVHAHYSLNGMVWGFKDSSSFSVQRAWAGNAKAYTKPAAPSHVEAIKDSLTLHLNAFIRDNPGDLVEVQRKHLTYEISHAYEKIQELENSLKEANTKRTNLVDRLRQLDNTNK